MSMRRSDYGATLEIFVGSKKGFTLLVENPETSDTKDLSNTSIYATGNVKIIKPDDTIISTVPIAYETPRSDGLITFVIDEIISTVANAGNWTGKAEFKNNVGDIIDQQVFNFNILECK